METTTRTLRPYRVEFSIFGADSGWRRAIVSAVTVNASSVEGARELAGYGDATWSVTEQN